jgi:putative phage-type endonuclease
MISDPNYKNLLISSIRVKYYFEPTLEENIEKLDILLKNISKLRSEPSTPYPSILKEGQLDELKNVYQPEQKTQEWYNFRHDHITASNAWKALGTTSSKNQLIFEKCQPLNTEKYNASFTETPMSWGNKYEHLTTLLYEEKNNTTIGSFGCIEHKEYPFLAASPDGIVTGETNHGRMIEIKNVVSREITGIPKKDYYIQMQLQMEVCDLNECDFVETKFIEYDTEEEFKAPTDKKKGVILVFTDEAIGFVYKYMPFNTVDYEAWMEETCANTTLPWFKNVYWRLDVYSCVLVKRQREWFQAAVPLFVSIWKTIQEERINGEYLKRAPKKRIRSENKNENELKPELLVYIDGPERD